MRKRAVRDIHQNPLLSSGRRQQVPKFLSLFLAFLFIFCLVSVPHVNAGPFRDYATFITAFKNLSDQYQRLMHYESIGRTVQNNDILMFTIGNVSGPRVLFDGAMHGFESVGGEVLFLYAKWLLTSGDPLAKLILGRDCTLLIPAVNVDKYNIARTNTHGVDLNRNFATGWEYGPSNPSSEYYRGSSPLSEPESQAITNVFRRLKPSFYVSLHGGATELFANTQGNRAYYNTLIGKTKTLSSQRGVPYYYSSFIDAAGFAMRDALEAGTIGFLLEVIDQSKITFSDIELTVLPRFIPVASVLSLEASGRTVRINSWDVNGDGRTDVIDVSIVVSAYASVPYMENWDSRADVNGDQSVDIVDLAVVSNHFGEINS